MRGYHARPLENVSAFLQSASKICGGTLLPPLWGSYIQGDILVPEIVDSLRKPQIITAQGIARISWLHILKSCTKCFRHSYFPSLGEALQQKMPLKFTSWPAVEFRHRPGPTPRGPITRG